MRDSISYIQLHYFQMNTYNCVVIMAHLLILCYRKGIIDFVIITQHFCEIYEYIFWPSHTVVYFFMLKFINESKYPTF